MFLCGLFSVLYFLILILCQTKAEECPEDRVEIVHDEARLHKDLLCAYNPDYRPVKNHGDSITVKIRFALKYITFDALEETFSIHSWVAMTWKDELLTWTPTNYGGIEEVIMESREIWTPRMALFNADASLYQSDSIYTTCTLAYNGSVTCVPHIVHSGICRTSLRRWPYDKQNCTMYFGSWMHTGEQVNFTFYKNSPVMYNDYIDGPGWHLMNVSHTRISNKFANNTYPMLRYTFMLQREAAGPAAIIVVPSIVLVLLTLTSLLMNVNDNTRLFLTCFSLFGHFTFLTEIGYVIPKYSADTPIILLFLRDSMIISLASILFTLLLMTLVNRKVPPPNWIVSINTLTKSGPGKYVVFTELDTSNITERKNLTEDGGDALNNEGPTTCNGWMQFVNLLNSCFFAVSFLVYLILISVYLP